MSHHIDAQFATGDPRFNVPDAHLFDAAPDCTVMVVTCCADAGLPAPAAFHPGATTRYFIR